MEPGLQPDLGAPSPRTWLTHHLLDSLAVVQPLLRQIGQGSVRLLDVGSGGGLPGAVVAIACPQIAVTCADTVLKKATFIQQVAASLKLPNLRGLHARVESVGVGGAEVAVSTWFVHAPLPRWRISPAGRARRSNPVVSGWP